MSDQPTSPSTSKDSLKDGKTALLSRTQKILILSGGLPGESRLQRFDKDRLVIGSVISADFRVAGEGVAPIHAVIELGGLSGGSAVIYDLASDTGVFVNGKKAITQPLKSGDEITVGLAKIKFAVEDRGSFVQKERVRETDGRKMFYSPDEDFKPLLLEEGAHVDPIFDYRPSSKSAVEVVMSWADTILNVEHFVDAPEVVLGPNRDADFPIPALLSNPEHALVVNQGGNYALAIEPKMRGVIQSKGELRDLKSMGQTQVPFGPEDFAKISIGDMDFYVSFTAAPPRLKRGRVVGKDPFFLKVLLTSMAMTGAILFGLSQLRVVPSLEAEQLPERLATILYQPEKYTQKQPEPPAPKVPSEPVKAEEKVPEPKKPPEPKPQKTVKLDITPKKNPEPKPIPKEMDVAPPAEKKATQPAKKAAASKGQNAAKEGEGAKAKGAEGSRGTKKAAPDKVHQKKATVAGSTGGPGAGTSHSQVKQIGNVDFLKDVSGKIENILAGAGAQLGKGGARVKDFGGFDTQGNGGSALSGSGKGGGGSSDIAAGLGNKGLGGGRIGTGLGAAGNGDGIVGGKARVAIRSGGPEEAVVMGSIDADAVEAALLAHKDEFRNCYEREINAEHPALAGRIGTTFVIGGSGRVTQAGIQSTTLNNANVERCVLNVIRRIDFPIPRGAEVQVTYPFKFSSVGR